MTLILNDGIPVTLSNSYYGLTSNANEYFATRLNSDSWINSTDSDKIKALQQATRAIDRLNYNGDKNDDDQILQFPRGEDTLVPRDIELATYEEALILLDDVDVQKEQANLDVIAHSFANVKTNYDRNVVPENIKAGIMSYTAWSYLKPFLRDISQIILTRG